MWQKVAKFKGAEYFRKALYKSTMKDQSLFRFIWSPCSYLGMDGCAAKTVAMTLDFRGRASSWSSSSDFSLRRTGLGGGAMMDPLA